MGRSRGGLTSKIHAVVDGNGLPVRLALSPGEAHDVRHAGKLLSRLKSAIRSASAPISTALATGSSGSLTGSNNVVGWRRAMTDLLPTTLPSFNSRQSGCGLSEITNDDPNEPHSGCPFRIL